ncbi:uncharacterized protein DS421_16g555300 [Arachis hypogaea]|nr:uncharacterized protein DS421_16g555300 [Arachis hypogaea]
MEGHNRTTCRVRRGISQSEGLGNDTFDNDSDDHMNIEDDSFVYDESASYSSNENRSTGELTLLNIYLFSTADS